MRNTKTLMPTIWLIVMITINMTCFTNCGDYGPDEETSGAKTHDIGNTTFEGQAVDIRSQIEIPHAQVISYPVGYEAYSSYYQEDTADSNGHFLVTHKGCERSGYHFEIRHPDYYAETFILHSDRFICRTFNSNYGFVMTPLPQ